MRKLETPRNWNNLNIKLNDVDWSRWLTVKELTGMRSNELIKLFIAKVLKDQEEQNA